MTEAVFVDAASRGRLPALVRQTRSACFWRCGAGRNHITPGPAGTART